jgi:hypothetical protein
MRELPQGVNCDIRYEFLITMALGINSVIRYNRESEGPRGLPFLYMMIPHYLVTCMIFMIALRKALQSLSILGWKGNILYIHV